MTAADTVVLGLLVPPALADELGRPLAEELPGQLAARFPDVEWQVAVADGLAGGALDLLEAGRRRLLDEGWELAVCLTEQPVLVGRRPVTAHASATHGVGIVSGPALGAVGVRRRLRAAVLRLVEGLLGEDDEDDGDPGARGRRLRRRLGELASPVGRAQAEDDQTVRFVAAVLRGNLRLLFGTVRANRPWQLVARLSRALAAALAAAAFALVTSDIWRLADGMSWPRLLLFSVVAVVGTAVSLVVAHDLWERRGRDAEAREQVVLFNLATAITVALGVLTLYAALLAATALGAVALITEEVLQGALGHPVGAADYARLAWLVTSLATVGGALGAAVESDLAVREAAYGLWADPEDAPDDAL